MKRSLCILACVCGALLASSKETGSEPGQPYKIPMPSTIDPPVRLPNSFDPAYKSSLGFEQNKGQWPSQVEFKADLGGGRRVFLEKNKFTYIVYDAQQLHRIHEEEHHTAKKDATVNAHAFEMVFVNANPSDALQGEGLNSFYYNYFIGNDRSKWAANVPVYRSLAYKNLYEGIDLVAYENEGQFKYDYIIKPGAKANAIQLEFNGAEKLQVKNKNLYITTSIGDIIESVPYSYQVIDGREVRVECEYRLHKDDRTVSFYLPNGYDERYELIIDPVVVASTYSGSSSSVYGHCATYDPAGNIYTGGRSFGAGYPTTVGAVQLTFGGSTDICVSKLNPTGSTLMYATYLGGNSSENPHSMFVDLNNELYVYGTSGSTNYPLSTGCYDNSSNGGTDMVVSKLNGTGTVLLGSTYVGGSGADGVNMAAQHNYGDEFRGEIVVNSAGEVFIAGTTASNDFPVTTGAYDGSHNGAQDAVVFKMNPGLTALLWATYLGGSGEEVGCSLRLNGTGDIYVVGLTAGGGFPITPGALTATYQGDSYDGFVARFNAAGTTLLNSTFIGTSSKDVTYFVDIDTFNGVYIYGISEGTMPISTGVYANPGSQTYIAKLNQSLTSIVYSTVLGNGSHNAFSPSALMVDICQNVYLAGWGSNTGYPVTASASQATTTGSCFHIMVLSQNAGSLLYGSFFGAGGEHVDGGTSRFDPAGKVYQAVCSCSPNFPTLPTAHSPTKVSSGCDIVVFKIDFQINCNPLLTNTVICHGSSAVITAMNVNNLSNPTYSMEPGGIVSTTPSFTVSPTVTTSYSIYITGTNGFNVVVTNTGISTVSVMPSPQLAPTFTQATCTSTTNAFNLGLSFLPSGPAPSYTVFWSPIPAGITSVTQTTLSGGIPGGTYNATVSTAYGCSASTVFTINPVPTSVSFSLSGSYIVTCANPTVTVVASSPNYSYTWYGNTANYTGSSASFTIGNAGTWQVIATDPVSGCVGTQSFVIGQNITASSSTVAPLLQNITCSVTSVVTVTAYASPSVNVSHHWITPFGGTLTMNGTPAIFPPGGPGTYTHVVVNNVNGCSFSTTFTVSSTAGFPTFSVSSPQNFTLGCGTKSIATINITNAQTTPTIGGAVSYTLLSPGAGPGYGTGNVSTYTAAVPGTWTVITKDNSNLCETRVLVSVLQNTIQPNVSAIVPQQMLSCFTPSVILQGLSSTANTAFQWQFPATPGIVSGNTIAVHTNTAQPSNTLIANYTLTVEDLNNTCRSSSVVAMQQNIYKPNAVISGTDNISCSTQSITLTNQSTTSIPPAMLPGNPVVGYSWNGPSPQTEVQLATTYVAFMPGTYTLIVRDMNNGCFATGTKTVDDFRDPPMIEKQEEPSIFDCAADGASIAPKLIGSTANYAYQWLFVPGVNYSSEKTQRTLVDKAGQYNIIITNTLNGCSSMAMIEVVNGTLHAAFVADQVTGYAPFTVNLTNNSVSSSTLNGTANITSHWNFGNGSTQSSIGQNTVLPVVYNQPGTYTITLFAQKGECLDSAALVVSVEIPSELIVPNIFTPNNDGSNDLFFVRAKNLDKIDIIIVDRWGHKVYELSTDVGNIAWDGKNQSGKEVAEGIYFYTLKASGRDGSKYDKKGTISLVR